VKIFIGADYKGLEKKTNLIPFLRKNGYEVFDSGAYVYAEGDDFNDPAIAVAKSVKANPNAFGILICDSAHGMTIQANRFKGVRAAHCAEPESAKLAREHDNANILCLSAHFLDQAAMEKIITTFLKTKFVELDRRLRRINRLDKEKYA